MTDQTALITLACLLTFIGCAGGTCLWLVCAEIKLMIRQRNDILEAIGCLRDGAEDHEKRISALEGRS